MRKGIVNLKIDFEDQKVIDKKFNSFEELEESFEFIRRKFK